MTVQQDEIFKAAAHGILLGCVLPIFGYNVGRRGNTLNAFIYAAIIGFELKHIVGHIKAYQETA